MNINKIFFIILGIGLFIDTKFFESPIINTLYFTSIFLIIFKFYIINLKILKIKKEIFIFLLFSLVYLINYFYIGHSIKSVIQCFIIFLYINYISENKVLFNFIDNLYIISKFYLIINILEILFNNNIDGLELNSNLLGVKVFLIYLLLRSDKCIFWKYICILLIFLSNSRSSLLGIIMFEGIYFIFNNFKIKVYKTFFYLFIFIKINFIWLYAIILPKISILNELSRKYTNKNFFSGRSELWQKGIEVLKEHFIFGIGTSFNSSYITGQELSMHNLDIRILLEVGIVGYFLFVIYFIFLIKRVRALDIEKINKDIFIGILISILFQQTFEISLIQNNIKVGFLQWLCIYIIILKYNGEKNGKDKKNSIN